MVKTASTMLPLGTKAPKFSLQDVTTGETIALKENTKQQPTATVIMFICNHCPFVKHINHELAKLAKDYQSKDIRFIAINSNDAESYPDDAPLHMQKIAEKEGYPFPYLYDETQEVAKAYQAACTPDFFIFDTSLSLVYRGQLDDARPGNNEPVNGHSIRTTLDCILAGKPVADEQKPSLGCNIKWRKD